MTQAVATTQEQPPRLPSIVSGGAIRAIVPQDFDSAWRIANVIVKSGMAPKGLDTPEKAMVAVMHGLEIGLTPMMAMQSIAVVNGKPTIYGDGAIGLVRGSGLLESIEETIEDRNSDLTAVCTVKRKGENTVVIRTFSMGDAQKAGLSTKDGPWKTYPKRMLQMRARAFALRDVFADVLKGLSIREEVEDYRPMKDVTPPATERDSGPPMPTNATQQSQPEQVQQIEQRTEPEAETIIEATASDVFDPAGFLRDLEGAASGCTTLEELAKVQDDMHKPNLDRLGPSDRKRATSIMVTAYTRISEAEDEPVNTLAAG